MKEILKRLELIKTAISIDDEEIIELQVVKLTKLEINDEVKAILAKLENLDFGEAVVGIEMYLKQYSGVVEYVDTEVQGLKLELKTLEKKLQRLSEKRVEYLNDIDDFSTMYNIKLGAIIQSILKLKEQILLKSLLEKEKKLQEDTAVLEDTKKIIDEFKSAINELKESLELIDENNENFEELNNSYKELQDELKRLEEEQKEQKENEKVKKIKEDASWLEDCRGKVFKMVSELLYHLPSGEKYKVIFMKREIAEMLASQRVMLERRGEKGAGVGDEKMAKLYKKHLRKIGQWLADQGNIDVLYVKYNDVIKHPDENAGTVCEFLGGGLNWQKMSGIVEKSLYRQRDSHQKGVEK